MGFNITPVVGLLEGPLFAKSRTWAKSPTPSRCRCSTCRGLYRSAGQTEWSAIATPCMSFSHPKYRIWGATAAMTLQLFLLLDLVLHLVGPRLDSLRPAEGPRRPTDRREWIGRFQQNFDLFGKSRQDQTA